MCYNSQAFLSLLESGKLSLSLQKQRSFFLPTQCSSMMRVRFGCLVLYVCLWPSLSPPHFVSLSLSLSFYNSLSLSLFLSFSLSFTLSVCVSACFRVLAGPFGSAQPWLSATFLSVLLFFLSFSLSLSFFLFLIFALPTWFSQSLSCSRKWKSDDFFLPIFLSDNHCCLHWWWLTLASWVKLSVV